MSSTTDQLFARARSLAEAAADKAVAAGEYQRPDASELAGSNYFEHTEPLLKREVAALPPGKRAELPPEDELWELLANEFFEAWEDRAVKSG